LKINIICFHISLTRHSFCKKRKDNYRKNWSLKSEENQLINDNKSYYLELARLQEEKKKNKSDLPNYELNETKKENNWIRKKIKNYKTQN
jgi:inner membrane protein